MSTEIGAIDAAIVLALAKGQGLDTPAERAPAVAAELARIATIAAPLMQVELGPDDVPGPVWRP